MIVVEKHSLDQQKFDQATRTLATGQSRRALLRGITGVALGGVLAAVGSAEAGAKPKSTTPCKAPNTKCGKGKDAVCCTSTEVCTDGACLPSTPSCPPGDLYDPDTGGCYTPIPGACTYEEELACDATVAGVDCLGAGCRYGECYTYALGGSRCAGGTGTCDGEICKTVYLCTFEEEAACQATAAGNECLHANCRRGVCDTYSLGESCAGGTGTCQEDGSCLPNPTIG